MIKNKNVIFTIDFEAWFQIENLSHLRDNLMLFDNSLLEQQLDILLRFLDEKKIKAYIQRPSHKWPLGQDLVLRYLTSMIQFTTCN